MLRPDREPGRKCVAQAPQQAHVDLQQIALAVEHLDADAAAGAASRDLIREKQRSVLDDERR
jgi:hypothetical protein